MTHTHFIGIGGTGLSAIAKVLLERGQMVSGSDRQPSPQSTRLEAMGARVYIGQKASQVEGADIVVRSSAVPDDNVEVLAAQQAGIPVLKRVDFLEQLLEGLTTIAVAGSHGKTTTTAMIVWILSALNQQPGFIAGGEVRNLDSNASAGRGPYFVIEADEYDYMFWGLHPKLAVVSNMEHDHPDCFPTLNSYQQAFQGFIDRILPEGTLIACQDDGGSVSLLDYARMHGIRTLTYSLDDTSADYFAGQVQSTPGSGFQFNFYKDKLPAIDCRLKIPGEHNVRNAIAALIVADKLKLDLGEASAALGDFRGAGRRFEVAGEIEGVTVIDDYGHHPTEIRATLAAAQVRYPQQRIWAVWQPHTYSRTTQLLGEFSAAFLDADQVLVTNVYAARESQPDNFSISQVVRSIQHPQARLTGELQTTTETLLDEVQPGDVVIVFSAGDADQVSADLLKGLLLREKNNA
jgi:UDP-N-acetylmuramate--alanine ligase